jgi:hypothetical protein
MVRPTSDSLRSLEEERGWGVVGESKLLLDVDGDEVTDASSDEDDVEAEFMEA